MTLGLLKFSTGRTYLPTSCCNFRGTDVLNNDHMMIMSLAVTSTSSIAMVPFAKTATTVIVMSPIMTGILHGDNHHGHHVRDVHREHDEYDVSSHDRGVDK
ncbi:unnamed protein product [Camellia sinensis]